LLLAELVGLVVLERHQLFEPVHDKVDATHTRVEEIHALITANARSSGQVTVCTSVPEMFRTMAHVLREALTRDQPAPQILRVARLAGVQARVSSLEGRPGPCRGMARVGKCDVGVHFDSRQPSGREGPAVVSSVPTNLRDDR
jgi:hypothetical protein